MQPPFQVKSLFPYESTYEDDLSFGSGVTITVTSVENDEWFSGEYDGKSAPVVPTLNRPVKRTTTQDLSTSDEPKSKPKPTEEPIVEPAESKPVESHSIPKPIESHSVPKPVSNIHKPVDPYSIKKQFVAASTSHYVPKVQPRDDYNLVVHPVHDTKEPDVRSNVDEQHKQEEDDAPKLTLKERIALIQKQQQEEAEREAAALKKKEERKKKQAAEKERLQQLKQSQPHVDTEPGIASHGTGETVGSEDFVPVSPVDRHRHSLPTGHDERNLEGEEEDNEEEQEEDAEHNDKEHGIVDEEEDEPEEEDEDEKRRKLVERMAKFAGGRNLFGLPFGAPAPPAKVPTRSKEVEPPIPTSAPPPPQNEEEDDEEEENEETPIVDKSIKLVKQNTTELEGTGYEADLSEASKVEGKREEEEDDEEDDDDEEELIEKPHHHHHHHHAPPPPPPPTTRDESEETPRHAPPPPPPGTRDDDEDEQEVEHQHHHHHHHRHGSKAAPPPPPPIPDQAPPIPGSISVPPLPSAPAPTSPVASSIPPPIPGSMPPIPGSAPPPPIPGTIPPPPVQPRYAEDEDGDEEEEEAKDEDNAGFESVENPPALPKRSGSEHKRRSFELPFTRSKSLKQPKEDIVKDLQRVIQKLDVRKHGQFKIQLELEVEDGKLLKYNVRS
ncbi:BBC1 Myosin tail region-interacting protein MTI1 [Candida maltosa Xu316]